MVIRSNPQEGKLLYHRRTTDAVSPIKRNRPRSGSFIGSVGSLMTGPMLMAVADGFPDIGRTSVGKAIRTWSNNTNNYDDSFIGRVKKRVKKHVLPFISNSKKGRENRRWLAKTAVDYLPTFGASNAGMALRRWARTNNKDKTNIGRFKRGFRNKVVPYLRSQNSQRGIEARKGLKKGLDKFYQ